MSPFFLFYSHQDHSVYLLNNEKMDSPTRAAFGRRQIDIDKGDMIIMRWWIPRTLSLKYTKHYDKAGSAMTRTRSLNLRPLRFLRNLCNERMRSLRVRRAILHNQTNSTFYKLPAEVFLAIAEYLQPVAILSRFKFTLGQKSNLGRFR